MALTPPLRMIDVRRIVREIRDICRDKDNRTQVNSLPAVYVRDIEDLCTQIIESKSVE